MQEFVMRGDRSDIGWRTASDSYGTSASTLLKDSMFLVRRYKNILLRRHTSLAVVAAVLLLWFIGVFDHFIEQSFDEFRWPPENVDVAVETVRADAGEVFRVSVENDLRLFHRLAEPRCIGWTGTLQLLIIVKSAVLNEKQRNAIRKTWGLHRRSARVVFVVGIAHEAANVSLQDEIRANSDILHVDVIDTYRNNTLKFFHSISYAFKPKEGCLLPNFVLLVDDDYMVHVNGLLRHVSRKNVSEHLYEGWRFDTSPFRVRLHKHAVSLDAYPFDRYPPYISAGAVLLSRKTTSYFYYAMQLVRFYSFDDIYAGILAYLLKISPTHNDAFVFWSRSIDAEEWRTDKVLAAHGYSDSQLVSEYPRIEGA